MPAALMTDRGLCIPSLLGTAAERAPGDNAIVACGRAPLTYGRLHRLIGETRDRLNRMGVGRADRVAAVIPNRPEMATAFAAIAASAICVPLNPAYRERECEFYLSDVEARALVVQSDIDSPAVEVARRRGIAVLELHPAPAAEAGLFTLSGAAREAPRQDGFARPTDTALILYTSGTTSRPKQVPLTHENICASACTIAATLALHRQDRCLNIMPLYHIHGLIGATLSTLAAGASLACPPTFDEVAFFAWLEEFGPSWYTAVPTMHHAIVSNAAEHTDVIARHPLRFIRSCSSPLPPQLMVALERAFNAPVIEAYGMTEGSHQISSNPLPPHARKISSVGVATGCEVAVMDETGTLVPVGVFGEVVIRGPNVTRGYGNSPEANTASFVNGWFRTGDQGLLDADGYLFIKGRLKEIINRGGIKTSPREIEEVLLDCPGIAQAVVFGIPHPALGEDIAAAVMLREDAALAEQDIRQFAATRLADFRVPSRILIVDEIPKGATGKLQRSQLAERFAPVLNSQFVEPSDPLEVELARTWAQILGVERVGADDNFFELGGTSLSAVRMMAEVGKVTGRNLPVATLYRTPTVRKLAGALRADTEISPSPVVALQPAGSGVPLFFLQGDYDGGGFYCLHLARALGPEQPFYVLHPHGFDGGPVPESIEAMAADHIARIRAHRPRGPYLLGGYCNGGMIALEMARRLRSRGERVELVILMDAMAPNIWAGARILRRLVDGVGAVAGLTPRQRLQHFVHLRRRYVAAADLARRRNYGRALRAVLLSSRWNGGGDPPGAESLNSTYHEMMEGHITQRYAGPVLLMLSQEFSAGGYDRRWRVMAPKLEVSVIPGDHMTFVTEHIQVVAEQLSACLRKLGIGTNGAAAKRCESSLVRGDEGGRVHAEAPLS